MDKCRHCGTELPPTHTGPCPKCGGKNRVLDLVASDGFEGGESIGFRQKRNGFDKFMVESVDGWSPSGDPKLKKGVKVVRIIDKEKKEYHHIVKDVATGEVTHEEHEPLEQHRHVNSENQEGVKSMGTKGRKNIKKPKQAKKKK